MRPRRENEPGEMEIRKASVSGEDKGGGREESNRK